MSLPNPVPRLAVLFVTLVLACPAIQVQATTIVQRDIREVAEGAALVVEGTVTAVESAPAMQGRAIATTVTVAIDEVLKGNWSEEAIALQYLGGSHNGRRMDVGEMQIPAVGEHGIYFVRDPHQRFVHPLKGWEQGHFIVVTDVPGGEETVRAGNGKAVVELPGDAAPRAQGQAVGNRVAAGLRTADSPDERALSAAAFRDWVRNRRTGR
jgi:hypothetical protein